MDPRSRAP
jgi:hypothetical protein